VLEIAENLGWIVLSAIGYPLCW